MPEFSRREFMQGLALGTAWLPGLALGDNDEPRASVASAFATDRQPKPLGFTSDQLDGLSKDLIESHWKNNYGGSVRALNTTNMQLSRALADDKTPAFIYDDLKREHLMRTNSVVLHEDYFGNLAPPGKRDAEFDRHLASAFGSVQRWEKEFRLIGAGLGGGSGWVMLAWNRHTGTLENFWMADHMHSPAASAPILVMDMYEHSYHMDYGAATTRYIDAFFRNIAWAAVADRLHNVLRTPA